MSPRLRREGRDCRHACPLFPGKRYLDWELEDPTGKPLETVRSIRDEIAERVRSLIADLPTPEVEA
ncbi:MAG: hypothetical protein ABSF27_09770 [Candidatus Dormibacteria bacterium]